MLGIAIGERVALVAEVSSSGGPGRATVQRVGEFWYASGADLAHPEALGRALADFLREQEFSTRTAVIGVPGKWVLTKRVDAPPAEPALVAETLRLQAEGEFASDGGDFAYDYAGRASASEAKPVLLMAMPRRQLDQVIALATAAGVRAVAVVPYAATLAAATARTAKNARMLLFGPGGAEFVAQNGGYPHLMRYLGPATSSPGFLAGELRRASAGAVFGTGTTPDHAQSNNGAAAAAGELHVWNDARLEPSAVRAFGEFAGSALRLGEPQALGVAGGAGAAQAPAGYAAAVSLAMAGLEYGTPAASASLPVDFLHSRLAVAKPVRVQPKVVAIAAAAALVLGVGVWAYTDISGRRAALDAMKAELKAKDEPIKLARATVGRVEFAQSWSGESPQFLACLNDLTTALPTDGKTYLTTFTLNEQLKGGFAGKAGSPDEVLRLLDRLKESGKFADVKASWDAAAPPAAGTRGGPQGAPPQSAPQPPGPQPGQPPPQPSPSGPQPMRAGMPADAAPGMVITPAMIDEPSALNLVEGSPNPVVAAKPPQAVAVAAAPQDGPPPGARPTRPPRGAGSEPGVRPAGATGGAGAPPAGEVTFSMSFQYLVNR